MPKLIKVYRGSDKSQSEIDMVKLAGDCDSTATIQKWRPLSEHHSGISSYAQVMRHIGRVFTNSAPSRVVSPIYPSGRFCGGLLASLLRGPASVL